MTIKLSEYAEKNGLKYKTVWKAFKEGRIKNARKLSTGSIVVDEDPQMDRLEDALDRFEKLLEKMEEKI
jgi:predicted site-specific integrase-resolvase